MMNAVEKNIPLRDVVGKHLETMGSRYERMVILTADLAKSFRIQGFIERYPDRIYNIGIAEQNMMSFAAGLAHEGFVPFALSFAPFASMRAAEQIRTDICYANLPVRIIGSYTGYSGGISGATHCALEDCAITTGFANMTVIEPCDGIEAMCLLDATMDWEGPVYCRMGSMAAAIYSGDVHYEIGKAMLPRQGDDGAFIVSGIAVHHAMEAAHRIEEKTGAKIRVVDMHTIKPLDQQAVIDAARTGRIVCAQDHNIIGGLGYAVAAVLAENGVACKYGILGCPDKYVPLATTQYLYGENEYDAKGLCKHMEAMLNG